MNDMIDVETGEITGEEIPAPALPVTEKTSPSLLMAIHKIVSELPVWITKDADAAISEKRNQKYASFKAILSVVRPLSLKHGVRIKQNCEHAWQLDTGAVKGRMVPVHTDLILSETGDSERTTVEIPLSRMDAQAMGSAISYGKRYCLLMAFGLATDEAEDDGEKTKHHDILKEHEDSTELLGLKDEINVMDSALKLKEWGEKLKNSGRAGNLSDVEGALLRKHFTDALRRLLLEPKEEGKKK